MTSPELTACDREPIHVPGSIQSHGHLLILGQDLTLRGVASGDERLAATPPGTPLQAILDGRLADLDLTDLPRDGRDEGAGARAVGRVDALGGAWDALTYRSGDHLMLELVPAQQAEALDARFLDRMQALDAMLERSASLADLYRNAAEAFRQLTGYARVLVYRFIDGDAGVVVGESRGAETDSFMNHHFPASDIPVQARALYVRNRIRVIADAQAPVLPITGADPGIAAVDLSDSMLRSVSPIHLRYLGNMGVRSSASMSIVQEGMLWGLIACHDPAPRNLSVVTRLACVSLAESLSRQIRLREETQLYRERIRLRSAEDAILAKLGNDEDLTPFFTEAAPALADLVGATGFAAIQGSDVFTHGACPPHGDLRAIADKLRKKAAGRPYSTIRLGTDLPGLTLREDIASGVLAATMSTEVPTVLIWLRAEELQVLTWAGNPHKDIPADPEAQLQPRASFEAWSEQVRGRSRRWTAAEVEAAGRLVRLLLEARNSLRIRRLNTELTLVIRENESLLRQKDFLLKEVNHRVQNSLSLVGSFLRLQARGAQPEVRVQLEEAQGRLGAVSLVHRRLYQDDRAEIVDLSIYLDDLLRDMRASLDARWRSCLESDFAPILVPADAAVTIGLLTNEIVANAIKYAYRGEPGPVTVTLATWRDGLRLQVTDRGVGSDGTVQGTGFGSRMIEALASQLGATVQIEDNAPGLRVSVFGPIG